MYNRQCEVNHIFKAFSDISMFDDIVCCNINIKIVHKIIEGLLNLVHLIQGQIDLFLVKYFFTTPYNIFTMI
jgi:hypothetical protein